jgi:hypothetical protein
MGQCGSHLGRDPARTLMNVEPAVPQGDQPVGGSRIVPVDVAPARIRGMGEAPVKLDHQAVALVENIPVLRAATAPDESLTGTTRQAMPPLNATQVPVLEHRVNTGGVSAEQLSKC